VDAVQNDLSDVAKLDQHFTDRRAQELALEAETQRAQHGVQMGGVRNERIRKAGIAALLGGAGIGLACFGASFLIAPNTRIVTVTKEVPGPERIVTVIKEVPGPERVVTVTKEVPGPERVTHDAPVAEVPAPVVPPVAPNYPSQNCSTMDGTGSYPCNKPSPYAAKTPDEQKFTNKPEYRDAVYRGRIVKSRDGHELSFEDGKDFHPGHWDDKTGKGVEDSDAVIDSDPYVGDLGMCVEDKDHKQMWDCTAMHNGKETIVGWKPRGDSANATPQPPASGTPPAVNMVNVDVVVGASYPVKAMVDTGCSWPMAIPRILADTLVREGLAALTSPAKSMLADGSTKDVDVIVINSITVDGRVLQDVLASVAPGDRAPILLGLGALNRLGAYTIEEGRIVFTADQPA
jgi:Aspartyl protease